jgi:predicted small secreted protein
MLKKLVLLAVISAMLVAFAGCNTVEGVGRDIGALGQGIQNVSK